MKTAILLIAAALVCGCKPDARIAQHQTEIAALRQEVTALQQQQAKEKQMLLDLTTLVQNYNAEQETNMDLVLNLAMQQVALSRHLSNSIPQLIAASQPKPMPVALYKSNQLAAAKAGNVYGVPDSIFKIISASAAQRYPTDFDMQEFHIRQQAEAWRKLHP